MRKICSALRDRDHFLPGKATDSTLGADLQLQQAHQWTYESYDAGTGRLLASKADLYFNSGALLPDGRFFYPSWAAGSVGKIASVETEPATGELLTKNNSSSQDIGGQTIAASHLTASRDGKVLSIVLERSTTDVYVGLLTASNNFSSLTGVHRFTHRAGRGYPTAWSPDGNSLLFDEMDGSYSVIARATDGAPDTVVADTGGRAVQGQFTPDGRYILFLHYVGTTMRVQSIDRVPIAGGPSSHVVEVDGLEDFHCSRSSAGRCLLRVRASEKEYAYREFDPESGAMQELRRQPVSNGVLGDWSLSPDGFSVAVTDHDSDNPSIRILSLPDNKTFTAKDRIVPVPGYGTVLGPSWDATGRGWFISTQSNAGYSLLHVDQKGRIALLQQSSQPIWGVPSHDGQRLAFPAVTPMNRNVWIGRIH